MVEMTEVERSPEYQRVREEIAVNLYERTMVARGVGRLKLTLLSKETQETWCEEADQILSIKGIAILEDGYLPVEPVQLEVLTPEEIITTLHWREAWVKAKSIHLRRLMKATNARNEAKFGKLYRRKE